MLHGMSYQLAYCVEILHEEWNRVTLVADGEEGRGEEGLFVCVYV